MWAAVLIPPVLRSRTVQRSGDTIGDFSHRLSALARRSGRRPAPNPTRGRIDSLARLQVGPVGSAPASPERTPGAMTPMQRRRRDVLCSLAGVSVAALLLGALTGAAIIWLAWFVATAATGLYVWLLLRMKQARAQAQNVHYLADRRPSAEPPAYVLSRSTGS